MYTYTKFLGTLTSFLIALGMFAASALAADKPNILIIGAMTSGCGISAPTIAV